MATFNSDVAAKQVDPTAKNLEDADRVEASVVSSDCEILVDSALAAALAQGDNFRLFRVPEGYRPIPADFTIDTDGLGATTSEAEIGTLADPDSILASTNVNAAAHVAAAGSGAEALAPATRTESEFLYLTLPVYTGTATVGRKLVVRGKFQKA